MLRAVTGVSIISVGPNTHYVTPNLTQRTTPQCCVFKSFLFHYSGSYTMTRPAGRGALSLSLGDLDSIVSKIIHRYSFTASYLALQLYILNGFSVWMFADLGNF